VSDDQPWSPAKATDRIRAMARQKRLSLSYKLHAGERLGERGIIASDLLYVLKFGFVLTEAAPATRAGFYRYAIENKTPNSHSRDIRLIVIPDEKRCLIKIVTVMWADELAIRAGTIV
jgi:hypothetical protein